MRDDQARKLAEAVRSAQSLAILTGAGISAESGLPTFRDPLTGLWANFRPEDLANADAFRRNPPFVWSWYAHRRAMARAARPNAGHMALARLRELVPAVTTVTQNVDGLHQAAGSHDVIELHGNIHAVRCFDRDHPMTLAAEDDLPDRLPECPLCGSFARPGVVWFGESLPHGAFDRAEAAARRCDVMLVVGTSGVVYPAAMLGEIALAHGATVAVVNPDPAAALRGGLFLQGPASVVLPEVLKIAWPEID